MTNRSIPRDRRPALQEGLEQLAEWCNYDDETKHFLPQVLGGDYIRPFFREYRRDYLEALLSASRSNPTPGATATPTSKTTTGIEYIDCDELFRLLQEKHGFRQPKYYGSGRNLSKQNWTALDHAARFVVRVLRFSWENDGEWTHGRFNPESDEGESDLEFYQVWCILNYLQAEWEAANFEVWNPDDLTRHLQ